MNSKMTYVLLIILYNIRGIVYNSLYWKLHPNLLKQTTLPLQGAYRSLDNFDSF